MSDSAPITTDPNRFGDRPFIAGTDVEVVGIVIAHDILKHTADQIAAQYHLDHTQIYAALSYYHTHKAELDALIETWKTRHERHQPEKPKRTENQGIFWLNANNVNFAVTRILYNEEANSLWQLMVMIWILGGVSWLFIGFSANFKTAPLIGITIGLVVSEVILTSIIYSMYADKRRGFNSLEQSGVILEGTVRDVTLRQNSRHQRIIKVRYQFTTPKGKLLTGSNGDINVNTARPLPTAGRPVRVVYVDDHTFRML